MLLNMKTLENKNITKTNKNNNNFKVYVFPNQKFTYHCKYV